MEESPQLGIDFDPVGTVIENAQCFDPDLPPSRNVVTRELRSVGGGEYVGFDGYLYRQVMNRPIDGSAPRFERTGERYERRPDEDFFA